MVSVIASARLHCFDRVVTIGRMLYRVLRAAAVLAATALVAAAPAAADTDAARTEAAGNATGSAHEYAWIQHVGARRLEVRAVAQGADCPPLIVDGTRQVMSVRAFQAGSLKASSGEFPVTVCAAGLPAGAQRATVSGRALPVPHGDPQRIAVLGDTGCRTPLEDCVSTWALPHIAEAVRDRHPDLIVHLGDYLYREHGCLIDTCGYGWLPWRADFMDTAADLLFPVAPLLLVRGNHEVCGRAAKGWFLLFDRDPPPAVCRDATGGWSVDIGSVNLVAFDTAAADDFWPHDIATYRSGLAAAGLAADKPNWLIEHKPVWGFDPLGHWLNATLQAAFAGAPLRSVEAVLAGHLHTTEIIAMKDRPVQIILGNGGADLMAFIPAERVLAAAEPGAPVLRAFTRGGYGFALFVREGSSWRMDLIDDQNRTVASCDLQGRCTVTKSQSNGGHDDVARAERAGHSYRTAASGRRAAAPILAAGGAGGRAR
jgi:hypothetical protein